MQISAFVDGELPHNEAELLLRRMCQDRELRQQAAEYLAMGRVMRGEHSIAGMKYLRERVAAVLDDTTLLQEDPVVAESDRPRFLRPLAGVAIAATVALAAIFGLRQMTAMPDIDPLQEGGAIAEAGDGRSYTVPDQDDGQLRDYYLSHTADSSYFGASSINARLVTLQLREDMDIESDVSEPQVDDEEAAPAESIDMQTP
ncbi:MAG: sigma-E factor negative regulatory protein [Gammaproteobacteria bacterium]|nr:sigma-E factor negative regulatory protein [Gammaproteobacteria bacterium]